MYAGLITDVEGVLVGHCHDDEAKTGVSAIVLEEGCVCGIDVRGSAPGTRETDFMKQGMSVDKANAIMLCGGSAFGLASVDGAMQFCEENNRGVITKEGCVPIIPAAVIYDLGIGKRDVRPTSQMGYKSCLNAKKQFEQGCVGVGCGATVGKLLGDTFMQKSGLGSASITLPNGTVVGAIIAVNAAGDIYDNGKIIAGAYNNGFINQEEFILANKVTYEEILKTNTTIGVIATDALLNKDFAVKIAQVGQDGLARSISPVHTGIDGDTLFALSCGKKACDINILITATAEVVRRAVANAIYASVG